MTEQKTLTGGCQCGAVRYQVVGEPIALWVCHCHECQKQSASAFGISVTVRSADLELIQGETKSWTRPTDSGRTLQNVFCPECGTRVWHGNKEETKTINIKGGSLNESIDLSLATHTWTSRKLPWVVIPDDTKRFEQEPD
jgi:hypothetical protein